MSKHYSGNDPGTGCGLIIMGMSVLLVVLSGVAWWIFGFQAVVGLLLTIALIAGVVGIFLGVFSTTESQN